MKKFAREQVAFKLFAKFPGPGEFVPSSTYQVYNDTMMLLSVEVTSFDNLQYIWMARQFTGS